MQLQTVRRHLCRIQTFLLAVAMAGGLACSSSEEPPVASNTNETTVQTTDAASIVYFDEDGNRTSPPKGVGSSAGPLRNSGPAPETQKSALEGGGIQVDLGERGMRYRVATKDASGKITIEETRDLEEPTEVAAPVADEKGEN